MILAPFEKAAAQFVMKWQLEKEYERYFRDFNHYLTFQECENLPSVTGHEILVVVKENPIGLISLSHEAHGVTHYGIMLDKDVWGTGCLPEAINLLHDYLFKKCGKRKLVASILASDERTLGAAKKCGYVQEGHLTQYTFCNGKFEDIILMVRNEL